MVRHGNRNFAGLKYPICNMLTYTFSMRNILAVINHCLKMEQ